MSMTHPVIPWAEARLAEYRTEAAQRRRRALQDRRNGSIMEGYSWLCWRQAMHGCRRMLREIRKYR